MNKMILLIGLVLAFSCKENQSSHPESSVDEVPAVEETKVESPEVALEIYDFDGLESLLNKKDEKTYVVNFWATWCVPCVKELPHFEELNQKYKGQNVEVLLVSLDFPNQYDSKLKPFIQEKKLTSQVVALNDPDMNTWIPKVDESWSGAIPATVIYNKDARKFFEKSFTLEELENELKPFLN
ncbi:TlpA family protein disulfide reductase [Mangrovimonas sp. CR14]|uniref:TlpA disulfide reductase family protein n=1 Tax=Mangrovimonas sp. CR14 TaxID=2706120 RepID=UPI001423DA96|nr:TlpA disulfide reductase family protein [Mangrovimonas sp. CR14]NIK92316.1 TlpA family protein disulfide reductase [Mangrovimonas sp. CR14]